MDNFNQELINRVKLFHSENDSEELFEEKYSFLKFVFKNIESLEPESVDICEEEFESLHSNIDGCFFDEDNSTYNLYVSIYNDKNNDETVIPNELFNEKINALITFLQKIINKKYYEFGEDSFTYEIADRIYKNVKNYEIVVNIYSNYIIPDSLKKDSIEDINDIRVSFRTYDLEDLEIKFGQLNRTNIETNVLELFGEGIYALLITSTPDYDVYLCAMRGTWLARLYKDDSVRLLEANVRSYLKRTAKVNAGILDTVKNSPEEFVSYNNGISAVATDIVVSKEYTRFSRLTKIDSIFNFQIVNGGQTTATLFECYKDKLADNLSKVNVPVKLTVVKNISNSENLIRNISLYSNTQTAIKKSDPPSNMPFYIEIKKLSQHCVSTNLSNNQSYICYFERTNGEYDTEFRRNNGTKRFSNTNPKDKKFTKIDLANAINCWEQHPSIVSEGREKCFTYFNNMAKNMIASPNEEFFKNGYSCIILYKKLDKLAKKLGLTYKSNVVSYTISYLSYITNKRLDLNEVWNSKDLPIYLIEYATLVMPKIHEVINNAPREYAEPRMWARKEKCWERIKEINMGFDFPIKNDSYNFFVPNDALMFINNENNFNDPMLWMKILLWNNKFKKLNKNQCGMVKTMRALGNKNDLTKKQVDYLQDIFMFAVKSGFDFNNKTIK